MPSHDGGRGLKSIFNLMPLGKHDFFSCKNFCLRSIGGLFHLFFTRNMHGKKGLKKLLGTFLWETVSFN